MMRITETALDGHTRFDAVVPICQLSGDTEKDCSSGEQWVNLSGGAINCFGYPSVELTASEGRIEIAYAEVK